MRGFSQLRHHERVSPGIYSVVRYSGNRFAQKRPRMLLQTVSSFALMSRKQVEW